MKISKHKLQQLIREELELLADMGPELPPARVDTDPRDTPPEKEFVDSPDVLAGYITVRARPNGEMVAQAPIMRTDGPDRPFLVRTTDTHWAVPHWMVRLIYPAVENVFNAVDSHEDWRGMNVGSRGSDDHFEWEWVSTMHKDVAI